MARYYLLLWVLILGVTTAFGQTPATLQGKVTDKESGEQLLYANIAVYKEGNLITGGQTDFDGNYSITPLDPGTYDIEASYVGYTKGRVEGIKVFAGKTITVDIGMVAEGITTETVTIVAYKEPLIEQDNTTQGATVTAEEIEKLPSKSISGIISNTAGAAQTDDNGGLSFRGSRENANDIYIDGQRVRGSMISQAEIEQMQVITGGLPAQFGDVTGGVISVTTKGPSSRFSGVGEVETSEYLDAFGYNLASLALSGPILRKKNADGQRTGESILGYRVFGQFRRNAERTPTATGIYKLTDDALARLQADPITLVDGSRVPSANFLGEEDVELVKARPNSDQNRYDGNAKLDFRLNKAIDMSVGGSFNLRDSRGVTNSLMNFDRTSQTDILQYRLYGRFRHRIASTEVSPDASEEEKKRVNSAIRNASYTIQFSYEQLSLASYDPIHKDNYWDYGYIGEFGLDRVPVINPVFDSISGLPTGEFTHDGYNNTITSYTAGSYNPVLTNYNKVVEGASRLDEYVYWNGFRPTSGGLMDVYGLHTNVGNIFNSNSKQQSNQYQFNINGSFELLPGGSEKGKHTVEFGLIYEQRIDRSWTLNPRGLWQIGRQRLNRQFNGLSDAQVGEVIINGVPVPLFDNLAQDAQWAAEDPENRTDQQSFFDKSVRAKFGYGRTEYVNIDELKPEDMSLDMFSADELLDAGLVDYRGYDYLGNILSSDVSFDDFFTARGTNGELLRPVAPTTPIYTAAYLQDKFYFKDIIFRVGLRIDRYDANTKVLKDDYSLFGTYNAADYDNNFGTTRPSTIGEDFAVYVDDVDGIERGTANVTAYRDGNEWFLPDGTAVNDPRFIFNERAFPALIDPAVENPKDTRYDYNAAFEDAGTQISVMPRLAFSFPISEDANFFAHYDILTQRPPSNSIATAIDYFNFVNIVQNNGVFNNPNLRPERTIDYEVGFTTKVSKTSALTISAYYKEFRDMIQAQKYFFAYPLEYEGFGNQDFGTAKGFSVEYDMRRTGNVRLGANYTLQFADGTGSSSNSQRSLTDRGNIRSLFPLNFDQRHTLTMNIDFRYRSGKAYNGPMIAGRQIFANAGVNLLTTAASGRPYTRNEIPNTISITTGDGGAGILGGINQARLPWNFRIDARIDKDFQLTSVTPEQKRENKRPVMLNIYLRSQNLLNARNIIGVYGYTQDPNDDGFFSSQRGQVTLQNQPNLDEYLLQYSWALLRPGNFTLPRRVFLGALVTF